MTKMGIRVWIKRMHDHFGDSAFTFSDLPEDLRSKPDFLTAASSGLIEKVGRQRVYGAGRWIWQVSAKGAKCSKRTYAGGRI